MRRGFSVGVALAAALATLSVAGCGAGAADPSGAGSRDHDVVLSASGAVLTLATVGGGTQRYPGGVASVDRTTVVTASTNAATTAVVARDVASGRLRWSRTVTGSYGVRVVSHDGSRAALGPGTYSSSDYPVVPRVTTPLVVVDPTVARAYTIAGNVEPEAFTVDGQALVLIEYLPAAAPDRYTIRLLDLATGHVGKITDIGGEDRQPMRGTARTSVMSPDGTRLYTYYAAPAGTIVHGAHFPAFVHVLDLAHRWAHCVGLPAPFGTDPVGIGISADGGTVVAADANAGAFAEIDTHAIALRRIRHVASMPGGTRAPSVAVAGSTIYVAAGPWVQAYNRHSLRRAGAWIGRGVIDGLRLDAAGTALFAALPGTVVVLRAADLRPRREYPVPNTAPVQSADPSTRNYNNARDVIKCAC